MLMIIAVNNPILEEKLRNKYYFQYEIMIINSKDALMCMRDEYLNAIVILNENLSGSATFESVIKYIKSVNSNLQVIVITKKLNKDVKKMLFSNEVFNIVEGENIDFQLLIECINTPKMVVYKEDKSFNKTNVILITGSRNSGKTISTIVISKNIAKICKSKKVIAIDLDYLNPSLNLYVDTSKNYSLKDLVNDVENNNLKSWSNYETQITEFNNLSYILNSIPINPPNVEISKKIIEELSNYYDYVIADTSSFSMNKVYKCSNYIIVHVINDTIKGIKDYIVDTMFINKEKLQKSIILFNCKKKGNIRGSICCDCYIKKDIKLAIKDKLGKKVNSNITKIYKKLGIKSYTKIKKIIINKLLQIGAENDE